MKWEAYGKKAEQNPEYVKAKAALKLHFALGNAVLRRRLEKGWSQSELARRVGTRQANISRIEAGQGNPTLELVRKLCDCLELEVDFQAKQAASSGKEAQVAKPRGTENNLFWKTVVWVGSSGRNPVEGLNLDYAVENQPIPVENWPVKA